jgi:Ca-activated chloride channel homolog
MMRAGHGKRRTTIGVLVGAVLLGACSLQTSTDGGTVTEETFAPGGDSRCVGVDMAVSSEKIALLTTLAKDFNANKDSKIDGKCIQVRPYTKSSGAAATLLVNGWPDPEANGAQPVVWSPASGGWGAIVNARTGTTIAPTTAKPFMLTPLVIAMPKPMADALGYPAKPVGFADIVALAKDPQGWAKYGHPEWGPFRLGKTNPNYSTSGLNFTIAQYYAATKKSSGLTIEDLNNPEVVTFAENVESAVVHYGDITMTFLNNWFRADARGTALTYASAVAVEEKSVIDYNKGNPDGVLDSGETPRVPKVPLVAVYPSEGTLFSDNPLFILDAPWVTPQQKQAAALFEAFVQLPANQAKVLEFGFRPANPDVPVAAPVEAANGVNPNEPSAVLDVPAPEVMVRLLDNWAEQRKAARVMIVMDVSGSMAEPADPDDADGATKLDLAKLAAQSALEQFKDEDEVGLRIFSTGLSLDTNQTFIDLVPIAPMAEGQRITLRSAIERLTPVQGTPLYAVTAASYTAMGDGYDATKINAVVLLTDGRNDDGKPGDDRQQLDGLLAELRVGSEGGANIRPIRVFPIAYGKDADKNILRQIAEASNAASYDASNPATIEQVFAAVISNF